MVLPEYYFHYIIFNSFNYSVSICPPFRFCSNSFITAPAISVYYAGTIISDRKHPKHSNCIPFCTLFSRNISLCIIIIRVFLPFGTNLRYFTYDFITFFICTIFFFCIFILFCYISSKIVCNEAFLPILVTVANYAWKPTYNS